MKFNLTTKEGIESVNKFITFAAQNNPILSLGNKIIDSIYNNNDIEKEQKTVEELIKKGKEQGVKEMQITLKSKNGFSINIPDANITTELGKNNTITLHVKF